jgi:hypothetical protein
MLIYRTVAQVKAASVSYAPVIPAEEEAHSSEAFEVPATETADYAIQSDPTMTHAGLTELEDLTISNVHAKEQAEVAQSGLPQNASLGEGNAAAETRWDSSNNDLSASQEWVDVSVPRDLAETDTGITATSAAATQPQSWSDEQPDAPAKVRKLLGKYLCALTN